ncbi:fused D-xylose transporter subunits of ABC superfamily: ATP-binding components [uncultured Pleomorphomonas sp.]|uniref:Fused D-xylose transporter subunits of ABC superfamily: ATP-binding components n=1 Tax=uncultured Pleomorphomonas sp. TaxID=442121 RepID=A0A212LI10_9HYPH|nr:sugar ABC transporter ATP-binding protein [uncultured Pleomorphomonas sp.]SCM76999.1 fused D-xylose transporter subunits of ABC superfamily: ATP-binding components [uncultured Pleomorphomonas sp.]
MSAATSDVILKINNVSKLFGPVAALKNMHLTVRAGRVHTLLGENGAGKSTLMKILAGVYHATTGEVEFCGAPYKPENPQQAAARGLTIVFQELSLCNNMTVAENILATREPSVYGFINDQALERRAAEIVRDLGLPIDVSEKVGHLSMAQRQLVEIAKGLSIDAPRLVILDEPTSSLTDAETEILFSIIGRLKAKGVAVIYISHRMEEIMRLSDDITVIRDGEYIATRQRENVTIDELIAMMVGRKMDEIYPPRLGAAPAESEAPILSVEGLSRDGEFEGVSFEVRKGEILGFFGLIGSGRSEVMNALFGMKAASGSIRIDGEPATIASPVDAIGRRIAFVTENRKEEGLVLAHSVEWNISMAALGRFAAALGFMRNRAERRAAREEVSRLTIKTASVDTPVGSLSGGNQQKAVLAKWLLTQPRILILDEPTRGVDVGAKFEIYKIIRQLAAEGTAILLVSSELPEVLGMSDRLVVMHEGRLSATLSGGATPEAVMAHATGITS